VLKTIQLYIIRWTSCVMETGVSIPGERRTGRGVDHTPPCSAEVEYGLSHISESPQRLLHMLWGSFYLSSIHITEVFLAGKDS
jgi:hypothetical protein